MITHTQPRPASVINATTSQERIATSLNVPAARRTVEIMAMSAWAEAVARDLLAEPLPRRWAHTQGVAATARTLAGLLGRDAELITAAAWLHDIGYSPAIAAAGFHPLDGAHHLRDRHHAGQLLCRLVAHHSCAVVEAAGRGLADELTAEFRRRQPASPTPSPTAT